jgi:hypothetical protein
METIGADRPDHRLTRRRPIAKKPVARQPP